MLPVKTGEAFWKLLEETARRVEKWPAWKRGGRAESDPAYVPFPPKLIFMAKVQYRMVGKSSLALPNEEV